MAWTGTHPWSRGLGPLHKTPRGLATGDGNRKIKPEIASTKTQDQVVPDRFKAGRAPTYQTPFQLVLPD